MDSKKIIESLQLPTLSRTLLEIIELEKKNSITILEDIRKTIERDPLLSAHILKVANSPFYGFSRKVRSISHAIGLLGIRKIKSLAFSFSIFDFLKKIDYKPVYGGTFNLILKKSLLISACTTILAKKTHYIDPEELYISALLSEIGQIIFFLHTSNQYCEVYSVLDKKLIPAENKLFNTNHIKMGMEFCSLYNFPEIFKTSIESHTILNIGDEANKILFIANQVAELLLTEDESEKTVIFKELENHTKKLLHLSLSEIEVTIRGLPEIMEAFTADFPEMQKDLKKIVETGATLIITLMKKEIELISLTRELTDTSKKLANEKIFLSHMLNLSYFFSSLIPPIKLISSLFEYFDNFINEFSIQFIYHLPDTDAFIWIKGRDNINGIPIDISSIPCLLKSKISNEPVRMEKEEAILLGKDVNLTSLIFPISYHNNFFGFMILDVEKNKYLQFDLEMTYVQILSNIIANSFQNYFSFEAMRNETHKKRFVTKELISYEKKCDNSRETIIELQKAEIIGELLPVIFHKLKNKLTPILGYSQILLSRSENAPISEKLKKIEKNANDLTSQLNMLRDHFKPKKAYKENENLNRIINHIKPYFDEIKAAQNIDIRIETDEMVPDDNLNAGQIETLIVNIVDNSVISIREKYKGRSGGIISVKTDFQKDGYRLIIRDNGIGMSEETIPRIWTPFFTLFPERTGIGLTVCEKIISNHNALYTVRAQENEFSEFEIYFKKSLLEEKVPLIELKPNSFAELQGKIMIIDDEAYLVDLMKEILMSEGILDIVTVTSGKEALKMMDNSFNLVISEIRMPEVNGMDIYDYLKSRKMESRFMVVTADPLAEDVSNFLRDNRVLYLKKPFELMKFKKIVMEKLSQ